LFLASFLGSAIAQTNTGGSTQIPLPTAFGEPGSINVSSSFGAASDSIQIVVPPGRRGVQPQLFLSYNSMGGSGIAGRGWGVGTGWVEKWRSDGIPETPAVEGEEGGERFTFSLGASGGELSDPGGTGVFRARIEKDYLPFRRNGDGWGVYDGQGNHYRFGSSPGSRIEGELWLLDRVEDAQGNTITYHYETECGLVSPCNDPENQKRYLSEVRYTGHAPTGDPGPHRVSFEYESRPDPRTSYQRGVREVSSLRLQRVTVRANSQLVRRYELSYVQHAAGMSLLDRVVLIGADDTSRVTLRENQYRQRELGWTNPVSWTLPQDLLDAEGRSSGVQLIDVNGDGFADLVTNNGDLHKGDGSGNFTFDNSWTGFPAGLTFSNGGRATGVRLLDVNGDIFPDVVVAQLNRTEIFLNSGKGWVLNSDWTNSLADLSVLKLAYVSDNYDGDCLATHCENEDSPDNCAPAHCIPAVPATEDSPGSPAIPQGCEVDNENFIAVHCEATDEHTGFFDSLVEDCKPAHCSDFAVDLDDPFFDGGIFDPFNPFDPPETNQEETFALVGEGGRATGVELSDLNGDGLVDIVWAIAYLGEALWFAEQPRFIRAVFLNGGDDNPGWHYNNTLSEALGNIQTPEGKLFFIVENEYKGYSFMDVNGDGMNDIVRAIKDIQEVYIRKGNEWISDADLGLQYAQSMADLEIATLARDLKGQGFIPMDFNDDGLTDWVQAKGASVAAYVNTGSGWSSFPAMVPVLDQLNVEFLDEDGRSTGTTLSDLDGDGIPDLVTASGQVGSDNRVVLGASVKSGLLLESRNALGEVTEIEWRSSSSFDNTRIDGVQGLPFTLPVVSRVTRRDGRGDSLVTEQRYASGLFEGRSLRGFGWAERKPSVGLRTETVFYQDENLTGRPVEISAFDSGGMLRSRVTFTLDRVPVAGHITQVQLRSVDTEGFDPGGSKHSQITNVYNDRQQVVAVTRDAEVSIAGDEVTTITTFIANAAGDAAGLWNLPVRTRTLGPSSELLAEDVKLYDGLPEGQAVRGLMSEFREWVGNGDYVVQGFAYDNYGNPVEVTDREGFVSRFEYDAATHTQRVKSTDALGRIRTSDFDHRFGSLISDVDESGNETTTSYDAFGRIARVVRPGDETSPFGSTDFTYSPVGDPGQQFVHMMVTEKSGTGEVYESTSMFDAWGNIYETHEEGSDSQTVVNLFEFDGVGQVTSFSSPFFVGESAQYVSTSRDDLGRPLSIVDQLGQSAGFEYRGLEIDVTDPRGEKTRFAYTPDGNLREVRQEVGGVEQVTSYDYDPLGRLTGLTDALGNETRIDYDKLGRRTRLEDPNAGVFEYRYDREGRLIEEIGPDGKSAFFTYSPTGELIEKVLPDASVQRFRYGGSGDTNAVGRLIEVEDGAGIVRFVYDQRGNIIEQRRTLGDRTYVTGYRFDALDRLTRIIYPDGFVVDYHYDEGGNIQSLTDGEGRTLAADFEYDAESRISRFVFGNGVVSDYAYDKLGRMVSSRSTTSQGVGLQDLLFEFDAADNVVALHDQIIDSSQAFTYDEANRLVHALGSYGEESYEYDAISNLLRKGNLHFVHADPLRPQRVTCALELGTPANPGRGKQTEPCEGAPDWIDPKQVSRAYAVGYDGRGNVASKGSTVYDYDGENRLARVRKANGQVIEENLYDASGELVLRSTQNETRIFIDGIYEEGQTHVSRHVYAGPLLIATLVQSKTQVELIKTTMEPAVEPVYVAGISGSGILLILIWLDSLFGNWIRRSLAGMVRACRTSPGSTALAVLLVFSTWSSPGHAGGKQRGHDARTYYYHANHLGSVHVVTDEKERVTARRDYRPYGEPIDWSGAQAGPRELLNTFQGQQMDDDTGLYYFKARHYDAELGRFMSADTVVADINDPRTLHRYAFEGGNPVNYVDPTGRIFDSISGWVDGAINDAGDWISGAVSDAGDWFDGAFTDIGAFFEEYGTEITIGIVIVGAAILIVGGIFTGGTSTLLGLALLGGGVGFGVGGGVAVALGYRADDWQFWAAAGIGAGLGAAGAVGLAGASASAGAGVTFGGLTKGGIVVTSVSKGAFIGGVAGGLEGFISAAVGGAGPDAIFNSTIAGIGLGAAIGAVGGAFGSVGKIANLTTRKNIAGFGLEVYRYGGWAGKAGRGFGKVFAVGSALAKVKTGAALAYAGLASSGAGRPLKLTVLVYNSDFEAAETGLNKAGDSVGSGVASILSPLGSSLARAQTASLRTSAAAY
jgi:RHS repeat-associated protein